MSYQSLYLRSLALQGKALNKAEEQIRLLVSYTWFVAPCNLYPLFCFLSSAFLFSMTTLFLCCPFGTPGTLAQGQAVSIPYGWAATYGGAKHARAYSVQETRDGGYIVAGVTDSFGAGKEDIWVLKLGVDGSIDPSCNFIRGTSISGKDSSATVKVPSIHSINSDAYPRDSSATVLDTNASVKILCP